MPGRRHALVALCVTEVVSWGVLYYALPVALTDIHADTGWSRTSITAAFSAGLLVSAVAGVPVGRWLDRYGPRRVMTGGSLLAGAAALGIGAAPSYGLFLLAWLVAGLAMAAVLYQAAFAALTGWYEADRVRALTALTLVAGLSSTVFAPLTEVLLAHLTWRQTYALLAGLLLLVTVPLHASLRLPWQQSDVGDGSTERLDLRRVLGSRVFLAPCLVLTVTAFGLFAASLTLIPLLTGRGFSDGLAATTLGLLGAGQLLGRLAYRPVAGHWGPVGRLLALATAAALSLALLGLVTGPTALLVVVAVLVGAVRGASTLLQATIVADLWGSQRYGSVAGWFSAPITAAAAVAPWGATAMAGLLDGGYPQVMLVLALSVLASAAVAAVVLRGARTPPARLAQD
ncbi:MAG: putative Permease of the major facilitator superfamily 1 [Frankiales bacterium]|nr:putative Permease of the major facilitator superfamily 1 [Frankiales bacterium]